MNRERWQQVERIFQSALDRDAASRPAFLDEACAGDHDLRRDVESLLGAHDPDDRFMESGALQHAARDLARETPWLTPGQRFDSYELIEPIGVGGMGEVWRALDAPLRREVAIKVLRPQFSRDPDRLRRFEQEAQASGMLNHPNVLTIYAIGRHEQSPYLVTELLEGETLRQRLEHGPIREGKAIEYGDQIVQGLAAAHAKGIVHRDLKPENLFLTGDDRMKILDFGLAKLAPSGPEHQNQTCTASGIALGTPAYMSPEQVRGQAADHRADIFAMGAVLYEMLAGRRPFAGETGVETMNAILRDDPPPIAGVSPQLEQIVRHCLEKEPAARYQSARDLAFQLRLVRHPSSPWPAPLPADPRRRAGRAVAGAMVLAATAGGTWWLTRPATPPPAPTFTRLTADSGLTTDPAFSADGKLVAYASDRAGRGDLDIWIQQLATGDATVLTPHPSDESEPAFSPDGSRIAFRSERDGGGIYIVSVFGGEPRLIAPRGRRPRFSPDGRQLAYWTGHFYSGQMYVVASTGGPPSRVHSEFASTLYPIWSADGRLLFLAARNPKDLAGDGFDWWVSSPAGGEPVKTGALPIMQSQGITAVPYRFVTFVAPGEWIGDEVVFSGATNQSSNLWRIALSRETARARGPAQQLTSGTSNETKPSVLPDGRMAFASLANTLNIWGLSIDANSGTNSGQARHVTSSVFDARTSVSAVGGKLAFISTRLGNADVWLKDLQSGKETALTTTPVSEQDAEITRDGERVCYLVVEAGRWALYQMATSGGVPEQICDDCGRPWEWSPDGRYILYLIEEGRRHATVGVGLLDVTTRQKTDYLHHADYSLARLRFSPDGRWISFVAGDVSGAHLVIAPFRHDSPPRPDEWISITEHSAIAQDKVRWSPDGNLLYFTSDVDGFRCIWTQPLDPASKRPVGPARPVYHSHSARRSLLNAGIPLFQELSLTADTLFFNLGETTGNIWLAEWKQ